jgi:hypothetical protein
MKFKPLIFPFLLLFVLPPSAALTVNSLDGLCWERCWSDEKERLAGHYLISVPKDCVKEVDKKMKASEVSKFFSHRWEPSLEFDMKWLVLDSKQDTMTKSVRTLEAFATGLSKACTIQPGAVECNQKHHHF